MNMTNKINNHLAIVFPGQGSQSLGMLADISLEFKEVQETFTEASDTLGYDLWKLVQHGPAQELDATVHTQPALLSASYAIWRILQTRNFDLPALLAGHSLGEYTALVCSNALSFADGVKLVAARGQYMQEALAPGLGGMAALIGLDEAAVNAICAQAKQAEEVLSPANFNSLGQIVIAGHKAAVDRALVLAKQEGAKLAVLIPVSVPSHCELMQPAALRLAALLESIPLQLPSIPVISNVDVKTYDSIEAIRQGLVRQLSLPVQWVKTIQQFSNHGITHIIECGPGKVLSGLIKRIDKNLQLTSTADRAGLSALDNERGA
jgi:[acyl-carrier-protein] S-malonyltransferase